MWFTKLFMSIVYKWSTSIELQVPVVQFSMASQRDLRPRTGNIKKSYKNTCGSPAPRTSLFHEPSNIMIKSTKGKKPVPTTGKTASDTLIYTMTGDRLPLGAVSIIIFHYIYLTSHDLVVQCVPWWWWCCNLYNLHDQFNLHSLCQLWT